MRARHEGAAGTGAEPGRGPRGGPGSRRADALPPQWRARARAIAAGELAPEPARRAATVMLLRDGAGGLEVHMLRRRASMEFAGGAYAYPGGAVDPRDEGPVRWAGPDHARWAERLGLAVAGTERTDRAEAVAGTGGIRSGTEPTADAGPGPNTAEAGAQALVCAAVRETFEESGVLLAGPDPDTVVADTVGPPWERDRAALVAREVSLADLLARRGLVLRSDLLRGWARWITPEFQPRRYDTWFFVAELPDGQDARNVSTEADHTVWVRPQEALAGHDRGELLMLPPTVVTLRELLPFHRVAEVRAAAEGRDLAPVRVSVRTDGEHLVLDWPDHLRP